ncbi:MAG: DUF4870 domain-containing protein [Cyanobacteria bacterium J06600_6]
MSQLEPKSEDRRKILSVLAHASILFSSTVLSIGIPLAIILLADDEVAISNAKEAFNFCLTVYLLAICCVPLMFALIGFPLLILLAIATMVMPIFAVVKIIKNPHRTYRYPLIWRLL